MTPFKSKMNINHKNNKKEKDKNERERRILQNYGDTDRNCSCNRYSERSQCENCKFHI